MKIAKYSFFETLSLFYPAFSSQQVYYVMCYPQKSFRT